MSPAPWHQPPPALCPSPPHSLSAASGDISSLMLLLLVDLLFGIPPLWVPFAALVPEEWGWRMVSIPRLCIPHRGWWRCPVGYCRATRLGGLRAATWPRAPCSETRMEQGPGMAGDMQAPLVWGQHPNTCPHCQYSPCSTRSSGGHCPLAQRSMPPWGTAPRPCREPWGCARGVCCPSLPVALAEAGKCPAAQTPPEGS